VKVNVSNDIMLVNVMVMIV